MKFCARYSLSVFGERADDAEVQRDVAAEGRRSDADLDVARVHVGGKKPSRNTWVKKMVTPSRASF